MSMKFLAVIILAVGIGIAVAEGVPQKLWDWGINTEVGLKLYSMAGGSEHLSGPLRGAFDNIVGASDLSVQGVIEFTNKHRDQNDSLLPLHENPQLNKAAEAKLKDMFDKQYFEHESPDGKSPADVIKGAGYSYIIVGENLALGNFKNDEVLVQAWMDSPGHRANILNDRFQEIGVAVGKGMFEGKQVWMAVQEFGTPLSACPSPELRDKNEINANRAKLAELEAELQRRKSDLTSKRYESNEEYNKAVADYNSLVERINSLSNDTQRLVNGYNTKVNAFNNCLESSS